MDAPFEPALDQFLHPGERVEWVTRRPARPPSIGTLIGGTVLILLFTTVFGVLAAAIIVAFAPIGDPGPSPEEFLTVVPWTLLAALILCLLVAGRQVYRGLPPRLFAVTSQRAMVISSPDTKPALGHQIGRDQLQRITRLEEPGSRDVVWRVHVRHTTSDSGTSHTHIETFGFHDLEDPAAAEQALLGPVRPLSRPTTDASHTLPPDHQQLLRDMMGPGEVATWAEAAQPGAIKRRVFPWLAVVGLGMFLAVLGWMHTKVQAFSDAWGPGSPAPIILGFMAFLAIAGVLGMIPKHRRLRARAAATAVYAVTNRRALVAQRASNGDLLVSSFPPPVADRVRTQQSPHGGTFHFTDAQALPNEFIVGQNGFERVRDAAGAGYALFDLGAMHQR